MTRSRVVMRARSGTAGHEDVREAGRAFVELRVRPPDGAGDGRVAIGDRLGDPLEEIREIQTYLTERAERHGVPVIESSGIEGATAAVLDLVLASAKRLEVLV